MLKDNRSALLVNYPRLAVLLVPLLLFRPLFEAAPSLVCAGRASPKGVICFKCRSLVFMRRHPRFMSGTCLLQVMRHMTLAIARARQPDGSLKTELARANPCFGQNKRPVFSDVVVEGAGPQRNGQHEREIWYAQLRLLSSCVDHQGQKRAYAFVKWYQKTGPQDGTKSIRLKWEMVNGPGGVEQIRYDVIGLQSIERLEHILPDPNNEGMFYVNGTRLV